MPSSRFLKMALVLGLLSAIGPFAIDMYLPALPDIGASLGAEIGAVQWSLTAFFLALAPKSGESFTTLRDAGMAWWGRKVPQNLLSAARDEDVPDADATRPVGPVKTPEPLELSRDQSDSLLTGEQVAQGQRSLTFRLRFRSPDRTLTSEEANAARDAAVAVAADRHGATLR